MTDGMRESSAPAALLGGVRQIMLRRSMNSTSTGRFEALSRSGGGSFSFSDLAGMQCFC